MKFLFVSEIAPYLNKKGELVITGGGEAHAFFLARELAKAGHNVKIVTGKWAVASEHEFIDGVEFVRYGSYADWFSNSVPLSLKNWALNSVKSVKLVEKVITEDCPDFVVAPMTFAFPRILVQAEAHKIPVIAEVHDVYPASVYLRHYKRDYGILVYPGSLYVLLYNSLPKYVSLVETVSSQTVNALVSKYGVKREQIFVTGNGIDVEKYIYSEEEKQQLIVILGRLVSYKNVDKAMQIYKKVKQHLKDAKLVIVGDGPERKKLEARAKNSGICFCGHVSEDEKLRILRKAKVLISCSEFEGFGMVSIEALASGVFPVLSDIMAHREVVGENGFLSDDVSACALAIEDLLVNDKKRRQLAKQGRDFVIANYTWSRVCEKFLKAISQYRGESA